MGMSMTTSPSNGSTTVHHRPGKGRPKPNVADTRQDKPQRRRKRRRTPTCGRVWMGASLMVAGFCLLAIPFFKGTPSDTVSTAATAQFQKVSEQAPLCTPIDAPEDISYTLVTQLSQDRLWMMEHHCQRYDVQQHAMSIAVYTTRTLEETLQAVHDMGCATDALLSVSVLDANTVGATDNYPVNDLRNLALSQVQTSHIIYLDVDFWTSQGLYDILDAPDIRQALWDDPQLALILPAFSLRRQCQEWKECPQDNIPKMPYTLHDLVHQVQQRQVGVFDATNKGGHGSTNYHEWIHQKPASLLEIPCVQSHRYEPFLVIRYCRNLPPFPAAFSGYGKNKMTWMMHVLRLGYALQQVGGIFLVHYPHLDSSSRQAWNQAPDSLKIGSTQLRKPKATDGDLHLQEYRRGQIDQLFVQFRNWLETTVPDQSRVPLCDGAQDDDSKLWIQTQPNVDTLQAAADSLAQRD